MKISSAEVTGGASTVSRQPKNRALPTGVSNLDRAEGCFVISPEGKRLIDFPMGQHGAIFGYNPPWLNKLLAEIILQKCSTVTSFPPSVEFRVAELLGRIRPRVEAVRFGKTGSDVCAAAVRLARAVTGRNKIVSYGYHGNDLEFVHAPQNRGAPEESLKLLEQIPWGELGPMRSALKGAACLILEVPPTEEPWYKVGEYLRGCSEQCHKEGALFILDEVVTGFRLALGGASEFYRVYSDLYCWGKALANGRCVSALGGKRDLMEEFDKGVFFSGTFFEDPLDLYAAEFTLERMLEMKYDPPQETLECLGTFFKDQFNTLAKQWGSTLKVAGQPQRSVFHALFEQELRYFKRECLERGVIFDRPNFITLEHTKTILSHVLEVCEEVFASWERVKEEPIVSSQ